MLEFIIDFIGVVIVLAAAVMFAFGSYFAAIENDQRKKNMRNGTHDYYGNKIEDEK
jgi:hypothetical protein